VSTRENFTTVADPNYFKQQKEEMYASEHDGFAPDIKEAIENLEWTDVLIFQFPLWWFGLPAILKGWVDRVFVMGRIYGGGKWYSNGAFKGKKAFLSLTTGGGDKMYTGPDSLQGDINSILFPINHGILAFGGFTVLPQFVAWSAAHVGDEARHKYLEEYEQRLLSVDTTTPIAYPPLEAYDFQTGRLKPDWNTADRA